MIALVFLALWFVIFLLYDQRRTQNELYRAQKKAFESTMATHQDWLFSQLYTMDSRVMKPDEKIESSPKKAEVVQLTDRYENILRGDIDDWD